MISYSTNQRRSVRWDSGWVEEVLAASGVEASTSGFNVVSGSTAQDALQSIDNVFNGFEVASASGVIAITDISNVSGVTGETLENLDVVTMGSGTNSIFRFSFAVPAQPIDPVNVRIYFVPRSSGTGNVKFSMDCNIFNQGDDLTPGSYAITGLVDTVAVANEQDKMKLASLTIAAAQFSSGGSAPYLVSCQVTRDTGVSGNLANDISVVQLYADNIPGGVLGQTAGYIGGNLTVDGNLVVEGTTTLSGLAILQGGTAPVASGSAGVSGSLIITDDFLYAAVGTNNWKRTSLASF